jgi:L-alanine-DL-glutamate epimerase-like enolase superfamily enzyme
MKITDVKAVPLSIPLKETPPRCLNAEPYSNHVLVKVLTDEGVAGYGEVFTRGASNSI